MTSLDPKLLRKTTDCPMCLAAGTFCPKGVFGQYWMKRCTTCGYHKDWPLPKITKKIIYLDQFAISNMVKGKEPFWAELHKRLSALAALQLIVCPYSRIHADESLLSYELRGALKQMYRSFGGNDRLRSPDEVQQDQLLRSIRQYLGISESHPRPTWCDAFDGDPHSWAAELQVFADFPIHEPWVVNLRKRKQSLHSDLESVCGYWREEEHGFMEDVNRESLSYGRTLIERYRELAGGRQHIDAMLPDELKGVFRACVGPDRFDPHTPPGPQPAVLLVHWLASEVRNALPETSDPVGVVEQFFTSSEAIDTPFLYTSSRLRACIAQKVRNPKGPRRPKASDAYDVQAIANYAPYCDAMFVDNEFRGMASQKNVDVPGKFNVRLFSMKTRDEFLIYLDDIHQGMSDAHREGLALSYPYLAVLPFLGGKVVTQ